MSCNFYGANLKAAAHELCKLCKLLKSYSYLDVNKYQIFNITFNGTTTLHGIIDVVSY